MSKMGKSGTVPARSRVLVRRETSAAYLYLLPALIFFIGFVIIPMIMCLFTSFFHYTMGGWILSSILVKNDAYFYAPS